MTNGLRVDAVRESSMDVSHACRKREGGALVAEGNFTHVAVDAETGETTRIPDEFREAVREFQAVPPDPV